MLYMLNELKLGIAYAALAGPTRSLPAAPAERSSLSERIRVCPSSRWRCAPLARMMHHQADPTVECVRVHLAPARRSESGGRGAGQGL